MGSREANGVRSHNPTFSRFFFSSGTKKLFHGAADRHVMDAKEGADIFHGKGPG